MTSFPKLSYACPLPWTTMRGDERERTCDQCARTVVNLSLLTSDQRAALLANPPPGGLCVAYYRRLSGEFVTAEKPLTPTESRTAKQYGLAALSLAAAAVAVECVPEASAALNHAGKTVATSYVVARDDAIARGAQALNNIAVRLGLKSPPPPVMILGMIICPPSTPTPPTPLPTTSP